MLRETGAQALYYNRDYEPYARERDALVEKLARSVGVEVHSYKDNVIHEADEVVKADGKPTASLPLTAGPGFPEQTRDGRTGCFPARKRMERAPVHSPSLRQGTRVCAQRSPAPGGRTGRPGSAQRLRRARSPPLRGKPRFPRPGRHVAFLAASSAGHALAPHGPGGGESGGGGRPEAKRSTDTFISELIWRDFYRQILWHFPHVARRRFQPEIRAVEMGEQRDAISRPGARAAPVIPSSMRACAS